jgi:transcriptional regulator with XRE-family HTH domain
VNIRQVVGDNIRFIRERRGLTQEDLSILSKMSKTFIGDIERGLKAPTTISLAKIAKALKIEPHLLLIPESYKKLEK